MTENKHSRRGFLRATAALSAPVVLGLAAGTALQVTAQPAEPAPADESLPQPIEPSQAAPEPAQTVLEPTPTCADADDVTPAQTEGPYFTPNSPERTSLLEGTVSGTVLHLSGRVLSTSCQPVAGALVDFWQADAAGQYDNVGYTFRGHQFTDVNGAWTLETVVPGLYPGRTRHIHVKVQAPNQPVLTTQLYFPGEARNRGDGIYNSALLVNVLDASDAVTATFDFVLAV